MLGYQNTAKLKNWKTPWGLNDFVTVCYALCLKIPVQSVPSSKSQTLAPVLLTHSVGCKNWSGSKSPQCGEKCWVLGPRKDRTRYSSTRSAFIYSRNHGMPLVHWSNIITSVHRPPHKPKRFRVEMVMGKYSMFWPSTNNDKKVLKWS